MIEKIIKDYLQDSLGLTGPNGRSRINLGTEYVLVEKTGSGAENHILRQH